MTQTSSSAKSNKSTKASKGAKSVPHLKSTLAAVKGNHSSQSSAEATSTAGTRTAIRSPTSSITKTPSDASIAPNTAKSLPSAPSASASTAISSAGLPAAVPSASSAFAPASNDRDGRSQKQDANRNPSGSQTLPSAPLAKPFVAAPPEAIKSIAPISAARGAAPYVAGEGPAKSGTVTQQSRAPPSLDAQVAVPEPAADAPYVADTGITDTHGAAPGDVAVTSAVANAYDTKDAGVSASELAAAIAGSAPVPGEQPLAGAVATSTPATLPLVNKATQLEIKGEAGTESMSTPSLSSSAAAAAQVPVYTPSEFARLQHNTFISRPSDPSRIAIRDLDASMLPAPLRPLNQQSGLARSPSHIVVFGWMDAPIRLVAKYAQPYTVLFPDATVVIQLSDGKSYLARENVRRHQLQCVITEITSSSPAAEGRALETDGNKDVGDSTITLIDHSEALSACSKDDNAEALKADGIVIHSFSDGGAGNLALFLDEMSRRKGPSPRVHSLIMDSSPGKANPRTGSVAFTMHLSNRPRLRAIVQFFVYIGLYLLKIWTKVTGQPGRGELMRKRLNSLKTWSWVTASYGSKPQAASVEKRLEGGERDYPPRMYMYSKADRLIPWQFVEEHANELAKLRSVQPGLVEMEEAAERQRLLSAAQKDGSERSERRYEVELRRWDRPPHCSIGRADFQGYWSAVMDFYMDVLKRN